MYPHLRYGARVTSILRAALMLIDVILTFFTAIPRSTVKYTSNEDHDNPEIRKRERSFD